MELDIRLIENQLKEYCADDIAKLIITYIRSSKLSNILLDLKGMESVINANYKNNKLKEFAFFVIDELKKGNRDIAIHPDPVYGENYVSANELLKNYIYPDKRKICYEIGEFLSNCSTSRIRGRCGFWIGCKDKRWGGGGDICMCRCEKVPDNFYQYHSDNDWEDAESFSVLPWTCKVGVRFYFKGERKIYPLTEYFKTLGPYKH